MQTNYGKNLIKVLKNLKIKEIENNQKYQEKSSQIVENLKIVRS